MSPPRRQLSARTLPRILILYTGGTFGMDPAPGARRASSKKATASSRQSVLLAVPRLSPAALRQRVFAQVPQIRNVANCEIDVFLNRDSSHIGPPEWVALARRIRELEPQYDGIVVLHGTDTLAYTACALSFLLRPCRKPVVLTGAQLPLASVLTDARRNLLSAIEVAAHGPRPLVNQVMIFFDDRLLQGNRARKKSDQDFEAFDSPKAPPVAYAGTGIRYLEAATPSSRARRTPTLEGAFSPRVAQLRLTPGFPAEVIASGLLDRVDALILNGFLSGTGPTHDPEFMRLLRKAREASLPVVLVTESSGTLSPLSSQNPAIYEAGRAMLDAGCLWAGDMTPECAFVKASWIAGQPGMATEARRADRWERFRSLWKTEFAGEGV